MRAIQARTKEIVVSARQVDLRKFETLSAERARAELCPVTLRHVDDAQRLLSDLAAAYAARAVSASDKRHPSRPSGLLPFERAVDAAVQSGADSRQLVEDVAYLVQLELRQQRERLERIEGSADLLTVLGECDSALRRIQKGLGAIDLALAGAEGTQPLIDFSSECQQSLQVRAAYAKLRARFLQGGAPARDELFARMRAVGTHMAVMVGWQAYPLLRVRDRLQLRELQQRVLRWLLPANRGDSAEGTRLWHDLAAFVEMLSLVNRRQELVEHDARVLGELSQMLEAAPELPPAAEPLLGQLAGLDDELDAILEDCASVPAERIGAVVGRLSAGLSSSGWSHT